MGELHTPPQHIEPIVQWYKRAQIDYDDHYIRLYIAYNTWYREVTNTTNDRQALAQLKKRVVIWDDYTNGKTMPHLKMLMERLVDLTQHEPLGQTTYWSGSIDSTTDWRSLIEYWYQVRCSLVHGAVVQRKYVWLAYETLDVFMNEIVNRMHDALKDFSLATKPISGEANESQGSTVKPQVATGRRVRQMLHDRYIASPDIWHVDMKRV